jgi:ABC-type nitrate/sulfonate/bicarbonate transport system substrate-binding protein
MQMLHRRAFLKSGVGALGVCGLVDRTGPTLAQTAPQSVIIGEAKGVGQSAQLPLGVYGGYFKREGVDVSIQQFNSGAEMGPALIAGSLKLIITGDIPGIPIMAAGAPVKALCPISDITGDQAIVAQASIKTPDDLLGKKVALFKGSTASLLIARYIAEHKLDADRIDLIHMDPLQQITALVSGGIDAFVGWEPHIWNAVKRAPGAHVLARGNQPTQLVRVFNLLLVRKDYLDANGDVVRKVLKGFVEAQKMMESGKADNQAAGYIRDKEGIDLPLDALESMMKQRNFTMRIDKDFIDAQTTNTQFLFEMGKIKQKPDVLSWIDSKPLREVEPSYVRI